MGHSNCRYLVSFSIISIIHCLLFCLAQKSEEKKEVVLNEQDDDDSDDENEEQSEKLDFTAQSVYTKNRLDKPVLSNDEQEKINDDLLYDPDEEEEDEKWMANERLKYIHILSSDFISKF